MKTRRNIQANIFSLLASVPRRKGRATRRQKKHDLLLTFMAQSKKQRTKPAPKPMSLLKTILSLFP